MEVVQFFKRRGKNTGVTGCVQPGSLRLERIL